MSREAHLERLWRGLGAAPGAAYEFSSEGQRAKAYRLSQARKAKEQAEQEAKAKAEQEAKASRVAPTSTPMSSVKVETDNMGTPPKTPGLKVAAEPKPFVSLKKTAETELPSKTKVTAKQRNFKTKSKACTEKAGKVNLAQICLVTSYLENECCS